MFNLKRKVLVGLGAFALVTAALAGTALAQTPPANQTPQAGSKSPIAQQFLANLASALGIDQTKLNDAIKQAANTTVDQEVQAGRITAERGNQIKQRIANGQFGFGEFGGWHGRRGGMGMAGQERSAVFNAVAQQLGMSPADLQTQLRSGKTIEQIAQEHNVSMTQIRTTVANTVKPQLDAQVKAGRITQERANQILQEIQNGQGPLFGFDHHKAGPGKAGPARSADSSPQPNADKLLTHRRAG